MTIHRKIYEEHFGSIPKDNTGRTYEIHHIDGNRKNNDISNLRAVTIQEHYAIHYQQKDYSACIRILSRMNKTTQQISLEASEINKQRAKEGKHPSQTKQFKEKMSKLKRRELELGIHPFSDNKKKSEWAKKGSRARVKNGTHHFCDSEFHRKHALDRLSQGTHNFQNQPKVQCPHCNKFGRLGPMKQWHFDNCKQVKGKKNEDI